MKKLSVLLSCAAVVGLALAGWTAADEKAPAKPDQGPAFSALKKLVGDWCQADKDGKPTGPIVTSYKLTAAGSVLHETIFPGAAHEMVSVYHLDGADLICTHYCALGNQPRLKAEPSKDPKVLTLKSISLSNGKSLNDMHMGYAVITFVDDNHYKSEWNALKDGKPDPAHVGKFDLARKAK